MDVVVLLSVAWKIFGRNQLRNAVLVAVNRKIAIAINSEG